MASEGSAEIYNRLREVENSAMQAKNSAELAHDRMINHEKICGERYQRINENIALLSSRAWQAITAIMALLAAILLKAYGLV